MTKWLDLYPNFSTFKTKLNAFQSDLISDSDGIFYTFLTAFFEKYSFLSESESVNNASVFKVMTQFKLVFIKVLNEQKKDIKDLIISSSDSITQSSDESIDEEDAQKFIQGGGSNKMLPSVISVISSFINLPNIYNILESKMKVVFSPVDSENRSSPDFFRLGDESIILDALSKGADQMILKRLETNDFLNHLEQKIQEHILQNDSKYKGKTGDIGPQGPQGPQGPTGPIGLKGDKGDLGTTNLGLVFDDEPNQVVTGPSLRSVNILLSDSIYKCDLVVVSVDNFDNTFHMFSMNGFPANEVFERIWDYDKPKKSYELKVALDVQKPNNFKVFNLGLVDVVIKKIVGYRLISVKGEKGEAGGLVSRDLNPNLVESYLNNSKTLSIQYPKNGIGDTFLMHHWGALRSDGFYPNKTEIFQIKPGSNPTNDLQMKLNAAETTVLKLTKNRSEVLNEDEVNAKIKVLRDDFIAELDHIEDSQGFHTIYNQHFLYNELNGTVKNQGQIRADFIPSQNSVNIESNDDWMKQNTKYIVEITYEYGLKSADKNLNTLNFWFQNIPTPKWSFVWRYLGSWNPSKSSKNNALANGWLEFDFQRNLKIILEIDVWNNQDKSRNYSFVVKGLNQKKDQIADFRCWAMKENVPPKDFIKNISLVSDTGSSSQQFSKPEHLKIVVKEEVHH